MSSQTLSVAVDAIQKVIRERLTGTEAQSILDALELEVFSGVMSQSPRDQILIAQPSERVQS